MIGLSIAIILSAVGVGVFGQISQGAGPKRGVIWGAVQFGLASLGSLAAAIVKPYIFPDFLVPDQGIFARKLSTGQLIFSWALDNIISYGPLVLVTGFMLLLVWGGASRGPARTAARNIDWRARLR